MLKQLPKKYKRQKSGSSMTELPPALFLLFFFAVFPMVNLIMMGLIFSSCVMLNNLELSEAARTPNSMLMANLPVIQDNWQSSGLGRLAVGSTTPVYDVNYSLVGPDAYVNVSTTFTVKPFFPIPLFSKVPALGAPWTFTINGKRVLENPAYANP